MNFIIEQLFHGGRFGVAGVTIPLMLLIGGVLVIIARPRRFEPKLTFGYVGLTILLANMIWIAVYCSWLGELFFHEGSAADALAAVAALELIKNMTQYTLAVLVFFC